MTEVLQETTTGLPELPEGLFWRIGDISSKYGDGRTRYGTGGWSSSVDGKCAAVQIMEMRDVRKSEKIAVYGNRWWNKNTIVDYNVEYHTEREAVSTMTRLFTGYSTYDIDSIPEHAVECGSMTSGGSKEWHYEYHINADGARAIAESMLEDYRRQVIREKAWEIAERAKREANETLFGDYPPKVLGGVK